MSKQTKGIGMFALAAVAVSSAIGGGAFNLANDLAGSASPGGILFSWGVIGLAIFALILALNYLVINKPELNGVSDYARSGFGNLVGFISGWGYWLSSWSGSVAFGVLMLASLDYFFPGKFQTDNGSLTLLSVILVSIIAWVLCFIVMNGVESAAVLNAIVLVTKLVPIGAFIIAAILCFKLDVFTAHFWENFAINAKGTITSWAPMTAGDLFTQLKDSLMVVIWVFVGIEGAAMMGDRAKKKSDAAKASILALVILLVVYLLISLLPFGYFTQEELANMKTPGLVYMMAAMVGPWGGALLSIGLTISVFGAWISWSMLPVEATTQLAEQKLLPSWFAKMNDKGAPVNGLWLTQWVIQVFFIVSYFITNVYDVFVLLCTAVMMICYALVGAYYAKIGFQTKNLKAIIIGGFACLFQVAALYFSGWQFLWLSMILYAVGFILYALSKREYGEKVHGHELVVMSILSLLGVTAIWGVFTNFAGLQDALGMDGVHLMFAVIPLVIITVITYFTINRHIDENKA